MYLAPTLNSHGLFQRLETWAHADAANAADLRLLLSRGTSAVVSIHTIQQLQRACFVEFGAFEDQLDHVEDEIAFASASLVRLQNEISPLLSSLRMMQDYLNVIVRRAFKLQLPRSLSETLKKVDKYDPPDDLRKLLEAYWASSGSRIRDYRILDQHYAGVSDRVLMLLRPERRLLILFPDDPAEQAREKMTYEKRVCGISEMQVGFDELHELVDNVAAMLGYEPWPLSSTVEMAQLGDLRPFRRRLLSLVFSNPVVTAEDGRVEMRVSATRISGLEDGKLEVQNLNPTSAGLQSYREGRVAPLTGEDQKGDG